MENNKSLAELLSSFEPKEKGVVLRVPDSEKQQLQQLASSQGLSLSDFVRQAIYYYAWATSPIELKTARTNQYPEYIDLQNVATYSIYLNNYLIADDTFDATGARTNKHRHSFHFGPLVFNYVTGNRHEAVLHPGETVRVYSAEYSPPFPPVGVSIWVSLPGKNMLWNNLLDRVAVYRIARKESEDIIAGLPSRNQGGLQSLLSRFALDELGDGGVK